MARGKKTGGRNWVKGQSGNPRGGAAHDPVKRAIRRMTQFQVAEVATLILEGKIDDLRKILGDKKAGIEADPNATPLQIWFASAIMRGISKGDMHSLSILLDRVVGKVKDKIELTGADDGPLNVKLMTDDELMHTLKDLLGES